MASLMGTYYHNIDAKGRMNFPTKLREILGTTFYVTKGLDQPCLTVCSAAEWIPQDLRQFAGLEKDVVVIGANTKAEIWDRARWEALNAAWDPGEMLQTLEEIGF